MRQDQELVNKTASGLVVVAGVVAIIGSPIWGFTPLVVVAAAGFAAATVCTILFPPER